MEWTWRTATKSNMPNSPKLPYFFQELFHEVSEPNHVGNAVVLEETHGNAVAGAAAASAVTQPPVDNVSLAYSCINKHHCTRHAFQESHIILVLLPPPPPPLNKGVVVGNDA